MRAAVFGGGQGGNIRFRGKKPDWMRFLDADNGTDSRTALKVDATHVSTANEICSGDGRNGRSLACLCSQDLVTMNLRSPSTVDFPFSDFQWKMHSKTADDSCIFTIKSYVDAQNAFEATVRAHYVAELKYHKRQWGFHNLTMN